MQVRKLQFTPNQPPFISITEGLTYIPGRVGYQYLDVNGKWYSLERSPASDVGIPVYTVTNDLQSNSPSLVQRVAFMAPMTAHMHQILGPVLLDMNQVNRPLSEVIAQLDAATAEFTALRVSYKRINETISIEVV